MRITLSRPLTRAITSGVCFLQQTRQQLVQQETHPQSARPTHASRAAASKATPVGETYPQGGTGSGFRCSARGKSVMGGSGSRPWPAPTGVPARSCSSDGAPGAEGYHFRTFGKA